MRKRLRRLFPSMFHRRLLLLTVLGLCLGSVLVAQAARLTLGEHHQESRGRAERALLHDRFVPTIRGRILDRNGLVLAEDRPGFAVVVDFDVLSGAWADRKGLDAAEDAAGPAWSRLSDTERQQRIAQARAPYDQQVQELWATLAGIGRVTPDQLEARRNRVLETVASRQSDVWRRWRERAQDRLGQSVPWARISQPIAEREAPHALLQGLDESRAAVIRRFRANAFGENADALEVWQAVDLQPTRRRQYPTHTLRVELPTDGLPSPLRDAFAGKPFVVDIEALAAPILGGTRPAYAEEIQARPFRPDQGIVDLGGYRDGDIAGANGVEASLEPWLRGDLGQITSHRRSREVLAEIPTRPGRDVRLTLDLRLQAWVRAVFHRDLGLAVMQPWHGELEDIGDRLDEELFGAAVVVEIDTGHVLAAVSHPTVAESDATTPWGRKIADDLSATPLIFRPAARAYQPGSTVKPLVVAAAITDGKIGPRQTLDVPGHLWENRPDVFRDWRFKAGGAPFGEIDSSEALMVSSNVFMGYLAGRLKPERVAWWYRRFGFGQALGAGLPEEVHGSAPADPDNPSSTAKPLTYEESCFVSIGQGPVAWTPLQAAHAYAMLVRRGRYIPTTFIADPPPSVVRTLAGRSPLSENAPPPLRKDAVDIALEGMRRSASDPQGTTRHLNKLDREPLWTTPGVTVLAKSGTAETSPLRQPIDDDGDGYPDRYGEVLKTGNHAWVVALVQPAGAPRPTHVVVVVLEYAGSGGQIAGPVANMVVRGIQDLGLLP
ncbi:MAG: penicillin-binding transpeptidase domain-containing protein [Planctomycetota bacterium]